MTQISPLSPSQKKKTCIFILYHTYKKIKNKIQIVFPPFKPLLILYD